MWVTLMLAGAMSASPHFSDPDQSFLARIHQATSKLSDQKASFVRFNKHVTPADAQRCRILRSHVPANSEAYIELSFVEAYYNLDYKSNLRQVLRPYRLWSTNIRRWNKEYSEPGATGWAEIDSTPLILNLLYLRHHDLQSMGIWLDLGMDGGPAEINDDTLGELWAWHQRDMLLACDGHPNRLENLTSALMFHNVLSGDEPRPYSDSKRKFAATLQPFVHSHDPRISRTAKALTRGILHNHLWQ